MKIAHTHRTQSISTNTELINAIKNNDLPPNAPHLMTAESQTNGRGQHNRSWLSPVGNVYLSLYVPMQQTISQNQSNHLQSLHRLTGALSLCVGLSLYELGIIKQINQYRQQFTLPLIQVKWANDLGLYRFNNSNDNTIAPFYKLAGILIEPVIKDNQILGIVIGVGLNINNTPIIKDGLYTAISLKDLIDELALHNVNDNLLNDLTAQKLYQPICQALFNAIQWHNDNTTPHKMGILLNDEFINAFNAVHALTDKQVGIFEQDAMATPTHIGQCIGIGKDGTLLLNDNGNVKAVFSGMAKVIY